MQNSVRYLWAMARCRGWCAEILGGFAVILHGERKRYEKNNEREHDALLGRQKAEGFAESFHRER